MDANILTMAQEAVAHIELKRLREARRKMEADPKPPPIDLSGWVTEVQASIKKQISTTAASIVHKAKVEIESTFSIDSLKAGVLKFFHMNLQNEIEPFLLLQYLLLLQKEMEELSFTREMQVFNSRFEGIDGSIRSWGSKIPKPFDKSLINMEKRFPINRVGFLQERPFDKWLSDGLKEKPIFFDSPNYIEKLIQFYNEVYLPLHEKEEKGEDIALSNGAMRAGGVA